MTDGPVILIGLDAAEWTLIRSLVADGQLPTLASLLETGRCGPLTSVAEHYAGGVWPTFYTGMDVPRHGVYHSKLWRQENMRCEMADADWLPARPFWETAVGRELRVCVIDMPMTVAAPAPVNGLQVSGWGTHDLLVRGSAPRALWRELSRQHGKPKMEVERFGPQDSAALLRLRENLLKATRQVAALGVELLAREPWDLFCQVFGAPHRAGHYLWDTSQVDLNGISGSDRATLKSALVDIYHVCDQALAQLMEVAPANATVCVFAVHGMEKNPGWSDLCPDLLARIQRGGNAPLPRQGLLYQIKRRLPVRRTEDLLTLLPLKLRHALVKVWSARMFDWNTTRYFPLPMDQAGYLRINLQGREPSGIVAPDREYEQLCEDLTGALMSWQDLDSNMPIVKETYPAYAEAVPDAAYRDRLPDLIVSWAETSALDSRGVRSDKFGEWLFSEPGKLRSGRSGNHSAWGWAVMTGPGIEAGDLQDGHILDLAPTVLALLGLPIPSEMPGQPLADLNLNN